MEADGGCVMGDLDWDWRRGFPLADQKLGLNPQTNPNHQLGIAFRRKLGQNNPRAEGF